MHTNSLTARRLRWLAFALLAALLGGCSTFSPDGGFTSVELTAKERLGKEVKWARSDTEQETAAARVTELLQKTLSIDDAVQIALLNNKGLQASFYELGIAEADLVQVGRLPNPGFSFARLKRGHEIEWERGLHFNLARLLAMPIATRMEARRFEQAQRQVTMQLLALAADTRKSYIMALSTAESARYMRQVKEAADASAELALRMAKVGNWSKLAQAREHGFYADAALNLARAELARSAAREKLTRLMGLWGEQIRFKLPERLPDLPKAPEELPNVEQTAIAQRLDLQAAKLDAEALARNLGLIKTTRFINVLELGVVRNTSNELPTQRGYEISFEIPLFDWGTAKVVKAEAIYMQAVNRAAEAAINARSEVREAYQGYRASYDIAKHYRDEIVPIKKRIADENLLRYNGMLIGVFELLADARSQIASVNGYIETLRDFWLAQADLDMAMLGKPAMSAAPKGAMMQTEAAGGH